jgi:hypothetical protein
MRRTIVERLSEGDETADLTDKLSLKMTLSANQAYFFHNDLSGKVREHAVRIAGMWKTMNVHHIHSLDYHFAGIGTLIKNCVGDFSFNLMWAVGEYLCKEGVCHIGIQLLRLYGQETFSGVVFMFEELLKRDWLGDLVEIPDDVLFNCHWGWTVRQPFLFRVLSIFKRGDERALEWLYDLMDNKECWVTICEMTHNPKMFPDDWRMSLTLAEMLQETIPEGASEDEKAHLSWLCNHFSGFGG